MAKVPNKPAASHADDTEANARATTYSRFIPREELGDIEVAAWHPANLGDGPNATGWTPSRGLASSAPGEHARTEMKSARQAGYQEGYRHGLSALQDFKDTHARQLGEQFGQLVASLEADLRAIEEHLAQAVTRTALELTRQILRDELRARPELVNRVAREAVEAMLPSARHLVVHVHSDDLAVVAEGAREVLAARGARLIADVGVSRGGVRVESDIGSVDASIERRWAYVVSTFGAIVPLTSAGPDEAPRSTPDGTPPVPSVFSEVPHDSP